MNINCEVIRDLLPLYTDDACSEMSRVMVEEHLQNCPSCRDLLQKLRENEIDQNLQAERADVLSYGAKRFKRRDQNLLHCFLLRNHFPVLST